MSLRNFTPTIQELLPGLVSSSRLDAPAERSREAYFMPSTEATYVLTADWPEKQERWDSPEAVAYPLRKLNTVEPLIDGRATYAAMLEAIETASGPEHFIVLLGWGLNTQFVMVNQPSSRTSLHGLTFLDVLKKKTEEGVKVRVLLWNNKLIPTEYNEAGRRNNLLQKALIDALNPSAPAPEETPRRALCILDSNTRIAGAHHQKVLLVYGAAGLIGFLGGLDIAEDRVAATKARLFIGEADVEVGAPLHDVHARVTGQAAHDLLTLAINRWNFATPVRAYYSEDEIRKKAFDTTLMYGADPAVPRGKSQADLAASGLLIEDLGVLTRAAGVTPQLVPTPHHTVRVGQTVGNPDLVALWGTPVAMSDAWQIIRHAIRSAREYIYIEDQYFWSQMAAQELAAAMPNIERLIVLVTADEADPSAPSLRHACIDKLFQSIVSDADKKKIGIYNRKEAYERYIHSKMLVIDDEVAIIGSANMNNRGYTHDSEVIGLITDPNWDDRNGPRDGGWYRMELNLARKLRMQLWAEHLRVDVERLFDPLAAAVYWEHPPPGANVMPCPYKAGDAGVKETVNVLKNATLDPLVWDPEGL